MFDPSTYKAPKKRISVASELDRLGYEVKIETGEQGRRYFIFEKAKPSVIYS